MREMMITNLSRKLLNKLVSVNCKNELFSPQEQLI